MADWEKINQTNVASTGGYGTMLANAPKAASVFDQAHAGVASAVKELSQIAQQAETIADQVFGAAGNTASLGRENPPPVGRSGALTTEIATLHQVINHLRTQIERLSCL